MANSPHRGRESDKASYCCSVFNYVCYVFHLRVACRVERGANVWCKWRSGVPGSRALKLEPSFAVAQVLGICGSEMPGLRSLRTKWTA